MSPEEIKFWEEVAALIKPIKPLEIEYRLHYDELGEITCCSMADHPPSNQYLVVDKETYTNYFRYRVVNGKLKLIDFGAGHRPHLKRSDSGYAVVKNHANLLLESNETYPTIEYYESNN